eukprot:c13481_g2_i1.p1 GENE.c13481_g2_i1~~c13481_g2_i1.p1  ORF type:complete len:221 (+),score=64.02 c13481_g2_i1:165-827(+)
MSFELNWPDLIDEELSSDLTNRLNEVLKFTADVNPALVKPVQCEQLSFGDKPEFDMGVREVLDCDEKQIRFTFDFAYRGNASITLYTQIQANAATSTSSLSKRAHNIMGIVAADKRYELPLRITLSDWNIKGQIEVQIDLISEDASITLQSDPLHEFKLSSNFDIITTAGDTVRQMVTSQVKDGIAQLLSVPQSFNFTHIKKNPPEQIQKLFNPTTTEKK